MIKSKEHIRNLIDEVVIPFEKYLLEDEKVSISLKDDEVRAKHNIAIAKLAIELLNDLVMARETVLRASKAHLELKIDIEDMKKYLTIFFKLHQDWSTRHVKIDFFHKNLMNRFNQLFIKLYMDGDTSNDFIMFDSEEIDEAINSMHHKDEKKITAVEYANYEEMLDDELQSILELQHDCDHIINLYENIDAQYINEFSNIVSTLASVLFSTIEFKDVGYTLSNFNMELTMVDIDLVDDVQKELIFMLLNQMNEDIQNWINTLFVTQEAIDIHYFDASFLANIAQFSIMVEQASSSEEQSEDDDFLF